MTGNFQLKPTIFFAAVSHEATADQNVPLRASLIYRIFFRYLFDLSLPQFWALRRRLRSSYMSYNKSVAKCPYYSCFVSGCYCNLKLGIMY